DGRDLPALRRDVHGGGSRALRAACRALVRPNPRGENCGRDRNRNGGGAMNIRRLLLVLATILTMLVGAPGAPAAAAQRTRVVDDDRQQCPNADYTSINAAIAAASTGDTIRVCPGLYNETVVVNKASLALRGSTDGSSTEPCLRGDSAANPTVDSVINGGIRLEANQVSLDRKSTRLNSSHVSISYAVFCL